MRAVRILAFVAVLMLKAITAFGQEPGAMVGVVNTPDRKAVQMGVAGQSQYFFSAADWLPAEELIRLAVQTGVKDTKELREGTGVKVKVVLDLRALRAFLKEWGTWDEEQKALIRAHLPPSP